MSHIYENHTLGTLRKEIDRLIAAHGENTYTNIEIDDFVARYDPVFHIELIPNADAIAYAKGHRDGYDAAK